MYDWLTRIVLEKSCKTVVVNVVNFFGPDQHCIYRWYEIMSVAAFTGLSFRQNAGSTAAD